MFCRSQRKNCKRKYSLKNVNYSDVVAFQMKNNIYCRKFRCLTWRSCWKNTSLIEMVLRILPCYHTHHTDNNLNQGPWDENSSELEITAFQHFVLFFCTNNKAMQLQNVLIHSPTGDKIATLTTVCLNYISMPKLIAFQYFLQLSAPMETGPQ